jgi:hypothetical protein
VVVPPLGLVLDLVVPVPVPDSPEPEFVVVPVPDPVDPLDSGVDAVSGIFGGVVVLGSGLIVVGVPSAPGVTGVVGVVAGVVGGACATVTTLGASVRGPGWVSAAYAAAAAPSTSTVVTASTVVAERQPGPSPSRLPGTAAPHCRHQS